MFEAYLAMYIRIKGHSYVGRDRHIDMFIQQKLLLRDATLLFETQRSSVVGQITIVLCRDVILSRLFQYYVKSRPYCNLKIRITPTKALMGNLCVQSFTQFLCVSPLLSRQLQGANTKISLKHSAII